MALWWTQRRPPLRPSIPDSWSQVGCCIDLFYGLHQIIIFLCPCHWMCLFTCPRRHNPPINYDVYWRGRQSIRLCWPCYPLPRWTSPLPPNHPHWRRGPFLSFKTATSKCGCSAAKRAPSTTKHHPLCLVGHHYPPRPRWRIHCCCLGPWHAVCGANLEVSKVHRPGEQGLFWPNRCLRGQSSTFRRLNGNEKVVGRPRDGG